MKALKFLLLAVSALSMITACSEDDTPKQETGNVNGTDLLISQLTGEWVIANQKNSNIYTFADDDTIYIKTQEGNTIDKWPYLPVAEDSIRIIRNWTTHNKVVFYFGDSIRIEDFLPSIAAVYPPLFGDAVLKKWLNDGTEAATDCKWEQVTPVMPSNEQTNRLDNVFSGNNKLLGSIKSDTLIVINHQADMVKLQGFSEYPDLWMAFDWENQSIIGGKISTPSVSDEILSRQLLECLDTSSYKYEIEVKNCTACYWAIGNHYFWGIYVKKLNTKNVSLIIKTVE